MACGCNSTSSSPPGTTRPTRSNAGISSSVGSGVVARTSSCSPSPCPTPPSSSQVGLTPYAPTWVATLLGAVTGKMLIIKDGAIYYFRAARSGVLSYNKNTEEITTGTDPFMSNVPQSTNYGRLGLLKPTVRNVYDPETEECCQEVVQEAASQDMSSRVDGRLVLANQPDCGELPSDQAGDAEQQTRFDYAALPDSPGAEEGTGLLIGVPGTRMAGSKTVLTTLWKLLKTLKFRLSMMGRTNVGSAEYTGAVFLVAIPTSGGTTADPAYQIKVLDKMPQMLPLTANEGDGLVFRSGNWVVGTPGTGTSLGFHPLTAPASIVTNRTTAGTVTVAMPSFPADADTVWAELRTVVSCAGAATVTTSGIRFAAVTGATVDTTAMVPVSASTAFAFTFASSGTSSLQVLGYYY